MGKKDKDLNPFAVVVKKIKKKKKKKKKKKRVDDDSDSSLSSGVEDGGLVKDQTDQKIFEDMFMQRDTGKVVMDASVYDKFSDNEESEEEAAERLGPGLRKGKAPRGSTDETAKKKDKKKRKKEKKKKKKKEKKKKKDKKKSKKKSDDSSDDSDSDLDYVKKKRAEIPRLDIKGAFKSLDNLLGAAESMKEELGGMFKHIDTGEELDINGIANPEIRENLERFFHQLLFKEGPEGGWMASSNTPKLYDFFSPNIDRYVFKPKPKKPKPKKKPKPASAVTEAAESSKEAVDPPKARAPRRAGPAMPSAQELEQAKILAEEKRWEMEKEESESDDMEGPMLPGQQSAIKERALENLRRVREMALEEKKLAAHKPKHEGWMTQMPGERSGNKNLMDQKGRTFSMKGVQKRGDTSEWTMTPEERKRKAAEKMLELHDPKTRKRGRLNLKGREETSSTKNKDDGGVRLSIPVNMPGEKSLLEIHQGDRAKKRRQIGGTTGFSFKAMRNDRQFNKKEASNMRNAGKQLSMGFSTGQVYKSDMG
eukprot:CAMPEP_0167789348 /NCGR_PEP_ID=MMETSP0111_2-20121227/10635_1 /TAXON_ID=91324 /ORGANISM="Lotharella globosa, Strain CCCM811" /LENGTH=536 /DNA_ID=CAMNT_0007681505 /DNA_START=14 /DNA_END=1624 /DNA_ORIENTATION=-